MPWADLTDARLYYELNGSGETVLLIPGLGATCNMWLPLLPELSQHFQTLTMDNRGMGRSELKRSALTLSHFAADIVELLDYLELERIHVVGISLGGIIAQCLALEHPQRVNRLVLLSCAHRFSPYLSEMARFMWRALSRLPRREYVRVMELLCVGPRYLDNDHARFEQHVKDVCNCLPPRLALLRQLKALRDSSFDPRDYHLCRPTLVMSGECDRLIPACYARDMAGEIPECQCAIIPDAGHPLVHECPEEVLSRMTAFLKNDPREARQETAPHLPRVAARPATKRNASGKRRVAA